MFLISGCKEKQPFEKSGGEYYRRGVRAYRQGNYKAAAQFFEKEIIFNPDNPDPYLAAGEIYEDYLNNKSKAREHYLKYVALSADDDLRAMVLDWMG